MKTTDDPFFPIAPRAMKYDDQIEQEIHGLLTEQILVLDTRAKLAYLMKATKGHYSPKLIMEMVEKYEANRPL